MMNIVIKIGTWFFCKIGDPIYSPSQAMMEGLTCAWCGKCHGTLKKAVDEARAKYLADRLEWIVSKYRELETGHIESEGEINGETR